MVSLDRSGEILARARPLIEAANSGGADEGYVPAGRHPDRAERARVDRPSMDRRRRRLGHGRDGYVDGMTPNPDTNEERHDSVRDDEGPDRHGSDPDSPGATIDDPEPAEPNEPG